jgi:hypothetical protein
MASYNGLLSSLIKGSSTGGEFAVLTGVSQAPIVSGFPAKHITQPMIGVLTTGISGTYSCHVIGAIGGCTFVVAGATGIASNGSTIFGSTSLVTGVLTAGRPAYCEFASAEDSSGFTSSVFVATQY